MWKCTSARSDCLLNENLRGVTFYCEIKNDLNVQDRENKVNSELSLSLSFNRIYSGWMLFIQILQKL